MNTVATVSRTLDCAMPSCSIENGQRLANAALLLGTVLHPTSDTDEFSQLCATIAEPGWSISPSDEVLLDESLGKISAAMSILQISRTGFVHDVLNQVTNIRANAECLADGMGEAFLRFLVEDTASLVGYDQYLNCYAERLDKLNTIRTKCKLEVRCERLASLVSDEKRAAFNEIVERIRSCVDSFATEDFNCSDEARVKAFAFSIMDLSDDLRHLVDGTTASANLEIGLEHTFELTAGSRSGSHTMRSSSQRHSRHSIGRTAAVQRTHPVPVGARL